MAFDLYEAHRRTQEKEKRLAEAERIAHLGSWELDIPTGRCYWSDEFFRICGFEPGSLQPSIGRGMKVIHPDDVPRAKEAVRNIIEHGEPYSYREANRQTRRGDTVCAVRGGDRIR